MKPLYLTEEHVRRLLPMRDCIGLLKKAFQTLSTGEAINQPRRRLLLPTRTMLHYMAAGDGRYLGIKTYATNPQHGAHFVFLLFRAEDGELLAILEANHLGQIRTGAASGLATGLLARPEARTVGLIGSGFQALTQLEATMAVRPVDSARVWSRSPEKREAFAAEGRRRFGIPVEAATSAETAVRDADIVITATNAAEPVLESSWISAGTHVNAMGSNQARRRELPADLVKRASLIVVDSREQSRMESGDLLMALEEGDWDRVVELQEIAAGRGGRTAPEDLTLFKSNGIALEDVVAAGYVYERAMEAGIGREPYS